LLAVIFCELVVYLHPELFSRYGNFNSKRVFMIKIRINGQEYQRNDGQTLLEVLLNHKVEIEFSCQRGVCQSCLVQCLDGAIPPRAQQGLSLEQQQQNYLLSCLCWPQNDMVIALPQQKIKKNCAN
jgi:ferredoxin